MNTCKTCKYWDNGSCDYSSGWDPVYKWGMKPNEFEIMGTALDDSGFEAFLVTGPDFGCNLYKLGELPLLHQSNSLI